MKKRSHTRLKQRKKERIMLEQRSFQRIPLSVVDSIQKIQNPKIKKKKKVSGVMKFNKA